jgi:hypothetical protein
VRLLKGEAFGAPLRTSGSGTHPPSLL